MTITREHLELAAKAAGYAVHWGPTNKAAVRTVDGIAYVWQPHEDASDAVRLAEDCKLQIDFYGEWVDFRVNGFKYSVKFGPLADNKETWMQAVTLAAAEIGREKSIGGIFATYVWEFAR